MYLAVQPHDTTFAFGVSSECVYSWNISDIFLCWSTWRCRCIPWRWWIAWQRYVLLCSPTVVLHCCVIIYNASQLNATGSCSLLHANELSFRITWWTLVNAHWLSCCSRSIYRRSSFTSTSRTVSRRARTFATATCRTVWCAWSASSCSRSYATESSTSRCVTQILTNHMVDFSQQKFWNLDLWIVCWWCSIIEFTIFIYRIYLSRCKRFVSSSVVSARQPVCFASSDNWTIRETRKPCPTAAEPANRETVTPYL